MKHVILTLALVAAVVAGGGCDRQDPSDRPQPYDPNVDAPPNVLVEASSNVPRGGGSTASTPKPKPAEPTPAEPTPAEPTPAEPTPAEPGGADDDANIATVKQLLTDAVADAKTGSTDKVIALFPTKTGEAILALDPRMKAMEQKAADFEQLIQDKFGGEAPESVKGMTGGGGEGGIGSPLDDFTKMDVEAMVFRGLEGKVSVDDGSGDGPTFAQGVDGWKIEVSPQQSQSITVLGEVMDGSEKFLDTLTAGINDGSITKENLDAKVEEVSKTTVLPAMMKLMAIMMSGAGAPSE
jgi:hypothetical protein